MIPVRKRVLALSVLALATAPAGAAADSWTRTDSMATARESFTATLLPNGQVLAAGGLTGSDSLRPTGTSERYDPASGRWLRSPSFAGERHHQGASLMADGRVLVTGGATASYDMLDTARVYDPATDAWSSTTDMPVAHGYHRQVTLDDGRVLVVGGHQSATDWSRGTARRDVDLYDPVLGAWTIAADMPYNMMNGSMTLLADGTVLVAGGVHESVYSNGSVRYYPARNSWRDVGFFSDPRQGQTGTLLADGRVLIAGGVGGTPLRTLRSAAIYDPVANRWTDVAPMASARTNAMATLLPNGKVLVAGGWNPETYATLNSAELFDPATNTWSPAPPMSTARSDATATLLDDGRVLIAGGSAGINAATAAAELYTPDGWPFGGGGGGSGGGGSDGGSSSGGGRPAISRLALSAKRFRAAASGPTAAVARRRRRAPVGTTVSWRDAAAATAAFRVQRPVPGRTSGGRCVKPRRANRRHRRCTRWVTVGRFTHADTTGPNSLRFSGRVRGHKLRPGRYRLNITARTGHARPSAARTIRFRIVR